MSLRYRIAITIVALEAVLIAALLWVTLDRSLQNDRDHAAETEQVWLQAIGDASVAALATGEAAELQSFIQSTLRHPRINTVVIADAADRVVAATTSDLISQPMPALEDGGDRYWRSADVRSQDSRIGRVAIEFSDTALNAAYREARNLGLMIGLAGLLFTAAVGLAVGYVLTRRLNILADAADGINAGDMTVPFVVSGTDEVSRLARAFDGMLRRLRESMAALTRARDLLVEPTEAMSQGFVLWDVNDRLVLCNTRFRGMFKEIDDHIAVGAAFEDLVARLHRHISGVEGDAMTVRDWLARRRAGPASASFVVDVCLRSRRWIKVAELRTREGGRVAICTDITEDKNRQRALYASERRLREIMASVFDGIVTIDGDGLIDSVNQAAQRMFRRSALDMLGQPVEQFLVAHARAGGVPPKGLTSADLASSPMQALREIGGVRKNGDVFPMEISVARIELQGRSTLICTVRDITERKAAEREILFHATHDALTGLPNRTLFDDRLTNALSHAKRSGETLALVFLDVDRFKVINDMLGHPIGDAVIIAVARRLLGQLRKSDTVARLGGDEFILLLRDVGSSRNAVTIGQGIVEAMRHPFQILGHDLHVTVSLGISTFPADGETADDLRKHADVALYRAKSGGRNQLRLFTPAMSPASGREMTIETDLRQALERQQFRLRYQPVVDLHSGRMVGIEALVRWRHPELGLIAPSQFLPFAETAGLMPSIGMWVIRSACTQWRTWRDATTEPLRMAVNLSARQLEHHDLPLKVAEIIHEAGVDAHALEFELHESTLMRLAEFEQQGDRRPARPRHRPRPRRFRHRLFVACASRTAFDPADQDRPVVHGGDRARRPRRASDQDDPGDGPRHGHDGRRRGDRDDPAGGDPARLRLRRRSGLPHRSSGQRRGDRRDPPQPGRAVASLQWRIRVRRSAPQARVAEAGEAHLAFVLRSALH